MTCSAACGPANFPTAPAFCAPRSIWRQAISICAIRCFIGSCTPAIRAPARQWKIYPSYDFAHGQSDAHRTHHPFDLHAGIRGSQAALRLVHRQSEGPGAPAPIRIRAPQSDLYGAVQTRADRTGARRAREWVGRSAYADARRAAPARRAAGSDTRFRQAHRRCQSQQRGRCRHVRLLGARSPQQKCIAPHGGAASAQGRDRELSGRAGRGT